ncbi:MAG: hypothetical protein J2P38_08425, partial [Candidatus Dormibacteraeota bacterium]|nr:hypothetical protein [Candidatus Dormibacteraeota bacterium]
PHLHHRARLRLPTFGWVLLATTLIYGLLAVSGFQNGRLAEFISLQLGVLLFLLIPVLFLAGTDFAEWAEVASGRLSSVLERLPRPGLLLGIAGVAVAVLAWAYLVVNGRPGFSLRGTVGDVLPVLFVAPPVVLVGGLSLRRSTSTRVPFWALASGAVILYVGVLASSAAPIVSQRGGPSPHLQPMVAARRQADPEYWLLVPQAWRRTPVSDGQMWSGSADGRPARLVLLWGSSESQGRLSSALGVPLSSHPAPSVHGWNAFTVRTTVMGRPAGGTLWTRRSGGHSWILAGVRAGGATAGSNALFESVRESWTPDAAGPKEGGGSNDGPGYFVIWVGGAAVVLLGLGLALLLLGRGEVATGGLFLVLCGLFNAAGPCVGGEAAQLVGAGRDYVAMGTLNLVVAAALVALPLSGLAVAIPGWSLPLPVLRLVFVLLLGFVGLEVLYDGVFSTALAAGARFSVIQGVVLLAAMLWDVLMSGESFTNTGGAAVPRHTRVLIYLGYTLLVVITVLFLSTEQVQGGGRIPGLAFESDEWPRDGIAALGPPLLLTFFFVNLSAWRRARPLGRADGLDQVDRSVLDEVRVG